MASISSIQVTAPVAGYAKAGVQVTIRVNFSAAVDLAGAAPRLLLNTSAAKYAVCTVSSAAGVSFLDFAYTVEAGVTSLADNVQVMAFDLNGATIKNTGTQTDSDLALVETTGNAVVIDAAAPTFTCANHSPEYAKVGDTVIIIITSSEPVADPTASVGGRSATRVGTTGLQHTFEYVINSADVEGALPLSVTGTDAAGNSTTATVSVPCKVVKTVPTAPAKPTEAGSLTNVGFVQFTWAEPSGGTFGADAIAGYNAKIYQGAAEIANLALTPTQLFAAAAVTGDGTSATQITCQVQAIDKAGNLSTWSEVSDPVLVNTLRPKCVISSAVGTKTNAESVDVAISFRNPVTDEAMAMSAVPLGAIRVANAAKGEITATDETGANYKVTIRPTTTGKVVVQVLPGMCIATNGNTSTASNTLSFDYDKTLPSCTVTPQYTKTSQSPIPFTIKFSKPVTGFTAADLTLSGHTDVTLTGQGSTYTALVTPSATVPATISVSVGAGVVADDYGNTNLASDTAVTYYDNRQPTISNVSVLESVSTIYGKGETMHAEVTFTPDKPLFIRTTDTARPYLDILIGNEQRRAYYKSGAGTCRLLFEYTVAWNDPAGSITNGSVQNADLITDAFGNAADGTSVDQLAAAGLSVDPDRAVLDDEDPGIHSDSSRSMSESTITGTLLDEAVIRSGIGDKDDLKVNVVAAANESWVPNIHKGWYYYQDSEYYLFADKVTKTSTNHVSGTGIDLALNKVGYDDSKILSYGPIIVTGLAPGNTVKTPYTQVSPALTACVPLTGGAQLTGTNNYQYLVAGTPVDFYRTNMSRPMRRVPTAEAVQDFNEYAVVAKLEAAALVYYVVVSGSEPVYATYIPAEAADKFTQHEIAQVDANLRVRTMYREVATGNPAYAATVTLLQDSVLTELDAEPMLSGNIISLPSTYTRSDGKQGTIKAGDRVAIKYRVNHSWVIDGSTVTIFHADAVNPTITVEYEGSTDDEWQAAEIPQTSSSYVQLNPLKDGVESGFLYIVDEATLPTTPHELKIAASTGAVTLRKGGDSQPARILVTALGSDGNPMSGARVYFSTYTRVLMTRGAGSADNVPGLPQAVDGRGITLESVYDGSRTYKVNTDFTFTWNTDKWVITWISGHKPATGAGYTLDVSPGPGKFVEGCFYPASLITNWRGELSAMWKPLFPGIAVILARATIEGSIHKSVTLLQHDYDALVSEAFDDSQLTQKLYLVLADHSEEPGTQVARCYVSDITGSYAIENADVVFKSQNSRYSTVSSVKTGKDGVATNNYHKSGADILWAECGSVRSNRIILGEEQ